MSGRPRFKRRRPTDTKVATEHWETESESGHPEEKRVRWEGSNQDPEKQDQSTAPAASDEETSDLAEKVFLTTVCHFGEIGCSYYDPVQCVIRVLEDTKDTHHFDVIKMVLDHASPEIILTSSRSDEGFIDTLREYSDANGGSFQIRPHKEFTPSKGRSRLLSLSLLTEFEKDNDNVSTSSPDTRLKNAYDFMQHRKSAVGDPAVQRWNASIRLSNFIAADSSPLCMSSVGALIDHLVRERAARDLDCETYDKLDIRGIEVLSLTDGMHINADALQALQIFESESHASVHSDRTKEGLSLFGTLNATETTLGRSLLRTWLLRPSLSIPTITARQDAVECFLLPENLATSGVMHGHLKGIKNVPKILRTLRAGNARLADWQGIVRFAFHATMLKEALCELHLGGSVNIVTKLKETLDVASFKEVGTAINDIIDWEESATSGRICVRPHVDDELDNRKHVYYGIDSVLSKVAEQIATVVPPNFSSLNVVYFPQLGYLICLPMLEEWQAGTTIQGLDDWTFQFSSAEHVYFKSPEMHDMDTHIGDLHSAIIDREIEILQDLLDRTLTYAGVMSAACDICAELDCLLSFASASRAYDYRRPRLTEENVIDIVQGRHPLHEQVVDTFVPNDTFLLGGRGAILYSSGEINVSDESNESSSGCSVVLLTGANGCGKSVYLKQIALIQIMAQIGCFVPAESATLGIADKIFTRLSTRESVSKAQSAFMIDLNQVSLALRNCTPRSLLILDEFGKGTLSTDGAGLFCGVLKHLLGLESQCPKVLAATHFHDVFRPDMLDPISTPITFLHMQVLFMISGSEVHLPGSSEDSTMRKALLPTEKITYLYRVAEGLAMESHAAQCAELCGIPSRYVERAQYVSDLISRHEIGRLLDEEMTEEDRADLADAEEVCRRFIAWDLGEEAEEPLNVKEKLAVVVGEEQEDNTD